MNYWYLLAGIVLIIIAIVIFKLVKNFLLNSIFGALGFLICYFVFGIRLPILATIVVSGIFGLAGLGVMLVLRFFGVV